MSSPTETDQDLSHESTPPQSDDGEPESYTREELTVQLELLREQNERLREEYRRSQQQTYRRSAGGLFGVGLLAVLGGFVFPESQTVLFALGGTGLFAGVVTYFLTPERFIAANVSEQVFEAATADREAILDELGLTGTPVYMPTAEPRLYVPEADRRDPQAQPLPDADALSQFFVTPDNADPGVAMTPTGKPLFDAFNRSLSTPLASTPHSLTPQLIDGLVETFELADGVDDSIDADGGRVTLEFASLAYGSPTQIDHPVCSFVATGLAVGLDTPIRVDVSQTDPPVVTYRWERTDDNAENQS